MCVESKKVSGGAGGGREDGGSSGRRKRRLDVSRPHVIPSYSTLSVRRTNFCCAENIRARFLARFCSREKSLLPEFSKMTTLCPPRVFSDHFFRLTALSDDPALDRPNYRTLARATSFESSTSIRWLTIIFPGHERWHGSPFASLARKSLFAADYV